MKLVKPLYTMLFALLLSSLCSCQKVININLNASAPRYVVEGNVTNLAGPYLITLTKSVNFDQSNVFPTVSGALVTITDSTAGLTDTLKETSPGNYQTSVLNGVPGHTYRLYINAGSNIFTSVSTMPAFVAMDSLYTQLSSFRANSYQLVPVYTDPIATGNYYHFAEVKNDTLVNNVAVRDDALINGQVVKLPVAGGLKTGDRVTLTLECIDAAVYKFYSTLEQTKNQNSASPANPINNLTGGALGYFSAHTSSSRSIVVP